MKIAYLAAAMAVAASGANAAEDWQGFYLGANAGYAHAKTDWTYDSTGQTADHSIKNGIYGLHGGYNFQWGHWVAGPEVSLDAGSLDGSARCPNNTFECRSKLKDIGSVSAKGGYALGSFLPFAKLGVASAKDYTETTNAAGTKFGDHDRRNGMLFGAGLDYAINPCWSVGAEWNWINFQKKTSIVDSGLAVHTDTDPQLLKAKVAYRF